MKLLLLVVAILGIWWALKLLHATSSPSKSPRRPPAENMVACHRCGLHVPESEAVEKGGRHYCCEAHARGEKG